MDLLDSIIKKLVRFLGSAGIKSWKKEYEALKKDFERRSKIRAIEKNAKGILARDFQTEQEKKQLFFDREIGQLEKELSRVFDKSPSPVTLELKERAKKVLKAAGKKIESLPVEKFDDDLWEFKYLELDKDVIKK